MFELLIVFIGSVRGQVLSYFFIWPSMFIGSQIAFEKVVTLRFRSHAKAAVVKIVSRHRGREKIPARKCGVAEVRLGCHMFFLGVREVFGCPCRGASLSFKNICKCLI